MIVTLSILAALIALHAFVAACELAVMTARPSRLEAMAARGNRGARHALALSRDSARLLSTVHLIMTMTAIIEGAYGERELAHHLEVWLNDYPTLAPHAQTISFITVISILSYLLLVVGELVPKQLGIAYPERVATLTSTPLWVMSRIAGLPVKALSSSTNALCRLLGIRPRREDVSEEDVKAMVAQATSTGVFDPMERRIFERALRVGDMTARSLMVPRADITWIDAGMPAEDVRVLIGTAPFSHFPVCEGSIDRLLGVVHVKDLISYGLLAGTEFKVSAVMQAPLYVPDSMPALKLLQVFQSNRARIAFVEDEHGGLEGLVTANDVVQALLGDLSRGGEDELPGAVRREDGSWLIDGRLPIPEVLATLGIDGDAAEDLPDVATAAGLVTALLGDLPRTGDRVSWHGWSFEVADLDGRRVDKLLVSPAPLQGRLSH
ncbi:MAG: hemolysin family protein [Planctomycetota bacterium]